MARHLSTNRTLIPVIDANSERCGLAGLSDLGPRQEEIARHVVIFVEDITAPQVLCPDNTEIAMPTDCADSSLRCAVTTTGSRPSSAAKLPEMPNSVAAPMACAKTLADIEYSGLHKTHIMKERMI